MTRIVYVNGTYLPENEAKISIFDRGFLFADGVYEVTAVLDSKLVDNDAHLSRLGQSLNKLTIAWPCHPEQVVEIQRKLVHENNLVEGVVYLQVTRGAADRDFAFPRAAVPSIVAFTQARAIRNLPAAKTGIGVVTVPDIRWHRRDIKTVGLLPASLAKQSALDAGANDAWLVEDGYVTEGSSCNAFIVTMDGTIITRQLSNDILHGITRRSILALAEREGLRVVERAFTPEEAYEAAEAFSTSASTFVLPVVKIDGRILGNGVPGPITTKLRKVYVEMAQGEAA